MKPTAEAAGEWNGRWTVPGRVSARNEADGRSRRRATTSAPRSRTAWDPQ